MEFRPPSTAPRSTGYEGSPRLAGPEARSVYERIANPEPDADPDVEETPAVDEPEPAPAKRADSPVEEDKATRPRSARRRTKGGRR